MFLPVVSKQLGEISRLELSGSNVKLRADLTEDLTPELVHSSPVFPILWGTIFMSTHDFCTFDLLLFLFLRLLEILENLL